MCRATLTPTSTARPKSTISLQESRRSPLAESRLSQDPLAKGSDRHREMRAKGLTGRPEFRSFRPRLPLPTNNRAGLVLDEPSRKPPTRLHLFSNAAQARTLQQNATSEPVLPSSIRARRAPATGTPRRRPTAPCSQQSSTAREHPSSRAPRKPRRGRLRQNRESPRCTACRDSVKINETVAASPAAISLSSRILRRKPCFASA